MNANYSGSPFLARLYGYPRPPLGHGRGIEWRRQLARVAGVTFSDRARIRRLAMAKRQHADADARRFGQAAAMLTRIDATWSDAHA